MEYEVIGIVATIFVLLSFLQTDSKKIRKLNIIGAGLFIVYGIFIRAYSTALLNFLLIIIHIVKLRNG